VETGATVADHQLELAGVQALGQQVAEELFPVVLCQVMFSAARRIE